MAFALFSLRSVPCPRRPGRTLPDLRVPGHRFGPPDDDVAHRVVRPDRPAVVDGLAGIGGCQRGVGRTRPVGVPVVGVPPFQAELPRDDLLGEIALRDEQRDDVHLLGVDGPEHLPEGRLFLPEGLPDLVERAHRPDGVRVVERRL